MRKVRAEHDIDCTPEAYWKLFFDRDFNQKLYLEELAFEAFEILEQSDTSRRIRVVPRVSMPKPVMKLLGDKFSYEERGRFDAKRGVWSWQVIPTALTGKLTNEGSVRVESLAEGRCRRLDEMRVQARVFGLGGIIESSTEKEVTGAWDKTAAFMNRWFAEHR